MQRGRGTYYGGYSTAPRAGGGSTEQNVYQTLVKQGLQNKMSKCDSELAEMQAKLAALMEQKEKKRLAEGGEPKPADAAATKEPEEPAKAKGPEIVQYVEGETEAIMDQVFAEMMEELHGYRPTKAQIAVYKSAALDDYDKEFEEYENEFVYGDGDDEGDFDGADAEYLYEESERQRLLQEMLAEEDNVDVCTDGAVFFDVEAQMKELQIQRSTETKQGVGASATPTDIALSGDNTEKKPVVSTASSFKLNATAKEWKPSY